MNKNKNPLQKSSLSLAFVPSLVAILIGLLVGIIVLTVSNPSQAMNGIKTLIFGGFTGGAKSIGNVLFYATPIIMSGLGVGFAFQTKMFNIGGPGQFIVGAYCALIVAIKFNLPGPLAWIVPLLAAMAGGALWALIPGLLRAYLNVNVIIATIMMNYIGMYTVNWLIPLTIYDRLKNQTLPIPAASTLPKAGLDKLFPNSMVDSGFLIALLAVAIVYIVLNRTTLGFELKSCGKNSDAAKYAGINEKRSIVISMLISGALIGLGGALMYMTSAGQFIKVADVLSAEGFNGIPVALLANNNPIAIIFSAIFIAYMQVSGFYMQTYQFSPEIVDIIISVIIYFSAFSLIIKDWFAGLLKRGKNQSAEPGAGDGKLGAESSPKEIDGKAEEGSAS